ncbi:hypothetical protein [Streptomyces neyagawaensis]|uniref:hypothetical protein n=1 Tax=Streptomyces neyagawaensis TaxID=42238 RepID=UPI00201CE729|nr:hypothetical protein [Streptomyces neyagawaensis]MCL6736049.1 hypothetical protein [Streptomyces neyagawaensis]MDE1684129.1 hypothetical protein [Streptomyces neyagawaensis]
MTPAAQVDGSEAEFGTGLQLTRVRPTADGRHEWWHGAGSRRAAPPTAPLAAHVPRHTAGARLVTPVASGAGLAYLADGPYSAAAWLRDPRPAARRLAAHALAAAGTALRDLHATPAPTGAPPPALTRLRGFADGTDGGDGDLAAVRRLREHAVRVWGPARLSTLRSWCAEVAAPAPAPAVALTSGDGDGEERGGRDGHGLVLVHGFASLGALVPPLSRGPVALLTGEDLGAARPELDLGWLLGDLAELAWAVPVWGEGPGVDLPAVLLDAYGPAADRALAARAAVLRIAAHTRDFAAYCGWSDELADYTAFVADLIDEEGRRAVPGGATTR